MAFYALAFLALLGVSGVSAAPCSNAANFPYAGQNVTIPITQVSFASPAGEGRPNLTTTVSGSIRIVDSCSFQLVNFNIANAPESANIKWYGASSGNTSAVAFPLSQTVVSDRASNLTFQLAQTPQGTLLDGISFSDFSQFRLFSEQAQWLIATADLPAPSRTTSATATASATPSAAATTSASRTTTTSAAATARATASATPTSAAFTFDAASLSFIVPAFLMALIF
ncbi:hypothetical protein HK102_013906 [Quaeritorhiza haematococci]|nr:hypothetical protein HK102_013906 [Quaeritorhiza haematococci]